MSEVDVLNREIRLCKKGKPENLLSCLVCDYVNIITSQVDVQGYFLSVLFEGGASSSSIYKGRHDLRKMKHNEVTTILVASLDLFGFDWTIENVQLLYDNFMKIIQIKNTGKGDNVD